MSHETILVSKIDDKYNNIIYHKNTTTHNSMWKYNSTINYKNYVGKEIAIFTTNKDKNGKNEYRRGILLGVPYRNMSNQYSIVIRTESSVRHTVVSNLIKSIRAKSDEPMIFNISRGHIINNTNEDACKYMDDFIKHYDEI
jgi:hypothetical protein